MNIGSMMDVVVEARSCECSVHIALFRIFNT